MFETLERSVSRKVSNPLVYGTGARLCAGVCTLCAPSLSMQPPSAFAGRKQTLFRVLVAICAAQFTDCGYRCGGMRGAVQKWHALVRARSMRARDGQIFLDSERDPCCDSNLGGSAARSLPALVCSPLKLERGLLLALYSC